MFRERPGASQAFSPWRLQDSLPEALEAFRRLSILEGIIPAFESAHAIAILDELADEVSSNSFEKIIVVNLSGRGDKDVYQARGLLKDLI